MQPTPKFLLPYFDEILARSVSEPDSDLVQIFGTRHVHWGYYADPATTDDSAAGLCVAAEALTERLVGMAAIKTGDRILDAGCGFGGTTAFINERYERVEVTGLNIDARQVARARELVSARAGNRIDFVEGDACAMPLPDRHFDAVLAVECIFHYPSRRRFFDEVRRVLKPGGRLVLSDFVPDGASLPALAWSGLLRLGQISGFYGSFNWFPPCTVNGYRWLARRTGLRLIAMEDITANTQPTYATLLRILRAIDHRPALSATEYIAEVSRLGQVRYLNLAFVAE
jgi:SAM-dependent methyltransferase